MKYFLDTEFAENGRTIDLISIGVVAEDGRKFYAVSSEFDEAACNHWVIANVLPKLVPHRDRHTRPRIAAMLDCFVRPHHALEPDNCRSPCRHCFATLSLSPNSALGGCPAVPEPEFWAYYADYDWVAVCQLYGRMIDLPKGWPMFCNDVNQWRRQLGLTREALPPDPEDEHHALADAEWCMRAHAALTAAVPVMGKPADSSEGIPSLAFPSQEHGRPVLPEVKLSRHEIRLAQTLSAWTVRVETLKSTWPETFGSKDQVRAFLRGVRAGCAVSGVGYLSVPDPDDPDLAVLDEAEQKSEMADAGGICKCCHCIQKQHADSWCPCACQECRPTADPKGPR